MSESCTNSDRKQARHDASLAVLEAAQLVGKSPRTIYKHIRSGSVSAQRSASGTLLLETSELVRAYGEICGSDSESANEGQSPSREMQAEIDRLQALPRQQNSQLMKLFDQREGRSRLRGIPKAERPLSQPGETLCVNDFMAGAGDLGREAA